MKELIVLGMLLATAIVFYALREKSDVHASLSLWNELKFEISAKGTKCNATRPNKGHEGRTEAK